MTSKRNGVYRCHCCKAPGKTFCDACKDLIRDRHERKRRFAPVPPGWDEHLAELAALVKEGAPLFAESMEVVPRVQVPRSERVYRREGT